MGRERKGKYRNLVIREIVRKFFDRGEYESNRKLTRGIDLSI